MYKQVLADLRERFSAENVAPINGFYCIPVIMASQKSWKEKLKSFMEDYIDDMPDSTSFDAEIDLWGNMWLSNSTDLPKTIKEVMERKPKTGFPNISRTLHLLAVLPVTTCSCERSISALKRIKTYTRSTMQQASILNRFVIKS